MTTNYFALRTYDGKFAAMQLETFTGTAYTRQHGKEHAEYILYFSAPANLTNFHAKAAGLIADAAKVEGGTFELLTALYPGGTLTPYGQPTAKAEAEAEARAEAATERPFTFSELKRVYVLAEEIDADPRELLRAIDDAIADGEGQTEDDDFLVLRSDCIREKVEEYISSDSYVLGCFKSWFIADITDWPLALIEASQAAEGFEKLGEAIIDGGFVSDMAEAYISADGAGHALAHYDGDEHEISFFDENEKGGRVYISIFRQN